jgi:hypothetical protein
MKRRCGAVARLALAALACAPTLASCAVGTTPPCGEGSFSGMYVGSMSVGQTAYYVMVKADGGGFLARAWVRGTVGVEETPDVVMGTVPYDVRSRDVERDGDCTVRFALAFPTEDDPSIRAEFNLSLLGRDPTSGVAYSAVGEVALSGGGRVRGTLLLDPKARWPDDSPGWAGGRDG